MSYSSIDKLQRTLADEVFTHCADRKKAAGRALGTLVELITFYTLCAWGLRDLIVIERRIPEFANPDILHNVEFSLHPCVSATQLLLTPLHLPITSSKILHAAGVTQSGLIKRNETVLTRSRIMRNAAIVAEHQAGFYIANIQNLTDDGCDITLSNLLQTPFAIFECKRVGVEEGMKKGPTTIEKAKQGAYVARSVSSLQKIRLDSGQPYGIVDQGGGKLRSGAYTSLLRQVIDGNEKELLSRFILTVGVVSNHGNWFTAEDPNKELRILSHSYDWLLFLTDKGLSQFIEKLLLNPIRDLQPARTAFLSSYCADAKANCFTKVRISVDADIALKSYFQSHAQEVEKWFNLISPSGCTISLLREDLVKLRKKDWTRLRQS